MTPDRQAQCIYCDKIVTSDPNDDTFEAMPDDEYDLVWCGCAKGSGT